MWNGGRVEAEWKKKSPVPQLTEDKKKNEFPINTFQKALSSYPEADELHF